MKKVYMLGICGTGMGNLAVMLKNMGYRVTGSDSKIYPPMSTVLEKEGIRLLKGYSADNIKELPDIAIIGNVIRRDNPEAERIMSSDIPYYSMPEALREFFFKDKKTIVISGTHGKTTSSFMAAWMLENSGLSPGFFIGGIPKDFEVMGRPAKGEYFVIEGDEYDTAFFDKKAKFFHYKPDYLTISSIEYDHADIYPDLDSIKSAFSSLVSEMKKDGVVIYNLDDSNVKKIAKKAPCKTVSYSINSKTADINLESMELINDSPEPKMRFNVLNRGNKESYTMSIPGKHNVANALSVIALGSELGLSSNKIAHALSSFKGIKRRQDVYAISGGRIIIDDFAHHPTAISHTIDAITKWYAPRRVWCLFEARSATSRTNILENELIDALSLAKRVMLPPVHEPERVDKAKRFDPERVCMELRKKGIDAEYMENTQKIVQSLVERTSPGDVILVMSNGGFDGIYEKLKNAFKD